LQRYWGKGMAEFKESETGPEIPVIELKLTVNEMFMKKINLWLEKRKIEEAKRDDPNKDLSLMVLNEIEWKIKSQERMQLLINDKGEIMADHKVQMIQFKYSLEKIRKLEERKHMEDMNDSPADIIWIVDRGLFDAFIKQCDERLTREFQFNIKEIEREMEQENEAKECYHDLKRK
jgi:hypothetical protein